MKCINIGAKTYFISILSLSGDSSKIFGTLCKKAARTELSFSNAHKQIPQTPHVNTSQDKAMLFYCNPSHPFLSFRKFLEETPFLCLVSGGVELE